MKAAKILSVLAMVLLLQGCWGSKETDEIAYVMVMGFDKGPGDNIIVTFQIANPKVIAGASPGGGGGGGGGRPLITLSAVAGLPIAAFNLVNADRSRQISLLHTTAYVFSEDLAREGLADYINPLNRYRETRGTSFVFISKGKARDFMEKNQPELETTPAKQYDLISRTYKQHSLSAVVHFNDFYSAIKSKDRQAVVPLVGINKKGLDTDDVDKPGELGGYVAGDMPSDKGEVQFLGLAAFYEDKMIGELTGDETKYFNIIKGKLSNSFLIIPDPVKKDYKVGMALKQARKPDIEVSFSEGRPLIDVKVYLEPDLVGIPSGVDYEHGEDKLKLEKVLSSFIRERCLQLIEKSQEEFRSDIFGFGRRAKKNFLTVQQWKEADWSEAYPRADVRVSVKVKIRRTGLMIRTLPTK